MRNVRLQHQSSAERIKTMKEMMLKDESTRDVMKRKMELKALNSKQASLKHTDGISRVIDFIERYRTRQHDS